MTSCLQHFFSLYSRFFGRRWYFVTRRWNDFFGFDSSFLSGRCDLMSCWLKHFFCPYCSFNSSSSNFLADILNNFFSLACNCRRWLNYFRRRCFDHLSHIMSLCSNFIWNQLKILLGGFHLLSCLVKHSDRLIRSIGHFTTLIMLSTPERLVLLLDIW
jgi:hypothetical protein